MLTVYLDHGRAIVLINLCWKNLHVSHFFFIAMRKGKNHLLCESLNLFLAILVFCILSQ